MSTNPAIGFDGIGGEMFGKLGEKTRVLIADEHASVRNILRRVFERDPDFEVIGVATTGEEAVDLAFRLRPGVVVIDANLPGIGGVEAVRRIRASVPSARVVGYSWAEHETPMRTAGVVVFVRKGQTTQGLLEAVRAVRP